jgi:hypothetical protein
MKTEQSLAAGQETNSPIVLSISVIAGGKILSARRRASFH